MDFECATALVRRVMETNHYANKARGNLGFQVKAGKNTKESNQF